jgi:dienelactone hydrolase
LTYLLGFLLLVASAGASPAYETEWVEFPALKEFNGEPVELSALLFRPAGPGPFPAIVMLHGCGGFYTRQGFVTASYRYWLDLLATHGYAALLVDSFNPRGHRTICEQQKRAILISRERVEDAYAALRWLAQRRDVRPDRIGLLGWSNGGSGTLYTLRASLRDRGFRAGVAFYPGCRALSQSKTPYRPYAPLLVLSGEADDWTPAAACVELAAIARQGGAPMEIVTYPGAHHSFDRINSPVRYRPDVRNANRPGGRGATVGEHPAAREDATRRTLEFFARQLKN